MISSISACGTAWASYRSPAAAGSVLGHRRLHIGDCADAGPWQRCAITICCGWAPQVWFAPASRRCSSARCGPVRHNRHPECHCGKFIAGLRDARSQPWFRRYMTTYLLFVPISLGTMLFSLRAAQSNGSLHVLARSFPALIGRRSDAVATDKTRLFGVRGLFAGQRTAQRRRAALLQHGGRVVSRVHAWRTARRSCWLRWPLKRWSPHRYRGSASSRLGRVSPQVNTVDQPPSAFTVLGSCARRNCPKACHHLAGCRRAGHWP